MTEKKTTTKAKTAKTKASTKAAKKPLTPQQAAKQKGTQTATRHLAKVKHARAAVSKRVPRPKVVMGFADFLREQSVVGLAIGLVIGAQVKSLADSLIASFINPLVGLVLPGKGALDQKNVYHAPGPKDRCFYVGVICGHASVVHDNGRRGLFCIQIA